MALLTLKFVTDVRNGDYEIVEFHGELDQSTIPSTEKQVADLLADFNRPYLIFDLTDLKFINSEGIGFVVTTHTTLLKKGQQLVICGLKKHVEDVMSLVGLPRLMQVFPTAQTAIDNLKKT